MPKSWTCFACARCFTSSVGTRITQATISEKLAAPAFTITAESFSPYQKQYNETMYEYKYVVTRIFEILIDILLISLPKILFDAHSFAVEGNDQGCSRGNKLCSTSHWKRSRSPQGLLLSDLANNGNTFQKQLFTCILCRLVALAYYI